MKKHKFVVMFIVGMLITPCIATATAIASGTPFSNYIHITGAVAIIILLVIVLWRKPKSKLGIIFVGLGVIQVSQAGNAFKGTMIYHSTIAPVPSIGRYVVMILATLVMFTIYYYIGYGLSKLYSKFISKKTAGNKSNKKGQLKK